MSILAMSISRNPSPVMTDEDASEILRRVSDLGGALTIINTNRLIIGKMTDALRRIVIKIEIIIAIIGSLSGLCGAILAPINIDVPDTVITVFFILSGLGSTCTVAIPKFIDFIKKFSGRSFWEEYPRWIKVREKFDDPSAFGDIQMTVLSMFAFVRPVKEIQDNESKRRQVAALNHVLSVLQCSQTMDQLIEAYNIVIPIFRIASTSRFISAKLA